MSKYEEQKRIMEARMLELLDLDHKPGEVNWKKGPVISYMGEPVPRYNRPKEETKYITPEGPRSLEIKERGFFECDCLKDLDAYNGFVPLMYPICFKCFCKPLVYLALILVTGYMLSFTGVYQWMDDNIGLPLHEWVVCNITEVDKPVCQL